MPTFGIKETYKIFRYTNKSSRLLIIKRLRVFEINQFLKFFMITKLTRDNIYHRQIHSSYEEAVIKAMFKKALKHEKMGVSHLIWFLQAYSDRHFIIKHLSPDKVVELIQKPLLPKVTWEDSWYNNSFPTVLEWMLESWNQTVLAFVYESILTCEVAKLASITEQQIIAWCAQAFSRKIDHQHFISAMRVIPAFKNCLSNSEIFKNAFINNVETFLLKEITDNVDPKRIVENLYPDGLSTDIAEESFDILIENPQTKKILPYLISAAFLRKIIDDMSFTFVEKVLQNCSPVMVLKDPIPRVQISGVFDDETRFEKMLRYSHLNANEQSAITTKFRELEMFLDPVSTLRKDAKTFVEFVKKHLLDDFMLLHFKEWSNLLETALSLPIDDKTHDELLFLSLKLRLANFAKTKNTTMLYSAYRICLYFKNPANLSSDGNLIIGEYLSEMANDSNYFIYKNLFAMTDVSTIYNSDLLFNLLLAKDSHVVMQKGLKHLQAGLDELPLTLRLTNPSYPMFLCRIEAGNQHVYVQSSSEDVHKKFSNKLAVLQKRSDILEDLGWHAYTNSLNLIVTNFLNQSDEDNNSSPINFLKSLAKLKSQFEMEEPYSKKQQDLVEEMQKAIHARLSYLPTPYNSFLIFKPVQDERAYLQKAIQQLDEVKLLTQGCKNKKRRLC